MLALLAVLTASTALATCGSTFVNSRSGRDSANCGTASAPCRTLAFARQRAQSCNVATRIFTVQGSSMTLVDVVLPPAGVGDHDTPLFLQPIFPHIGFLWNPAHYGFPLNRLPAEVPPPPGRSEREVRQQ